MFSFSADDVKTVIINATGISCTIKNYSLEPFTEKKLGTFGSHNLLKVSIENSVGERETLTFFVKSLPESQVIRDLSDDVILEELNFYKNIKPLMDNKSVKWSPECYLAENNILVIQDLRAQGFSIHRTWFDEKLLKPALESLAAFHVSTLVAESKLGKPLNEAFPDFFLEKNFNASKNIGRYTTLGFQTIVVMAGKLNLDASFVLPHMYDYIYEAVTPRQEELNVLCHGDLWTNNFLFDENNKCIIIDYQALRYASPVLDLSLLLYSNTTPKYMKKFENEMVNYYYCIFQKLVENSNLKRKIPTLASMMTTYRKYRIFGMVMASINVPLKFIESQQAQKLVNDPKALERYMLYDRMEIIGPYLETSPIYANKIKDVLCEVLNEGKRVLNL